METTENSPDMSLEQAQATVATKPHPKITKEHIQDRIEEVRYLVEDTATICLITMANGFQAHGYSKPADARNYDAQVGERYAYEDAFKKLWPLEAYLLLERIARGELDEPDAPAEPEFPPGLHVYVSHKVVTAGKISAAAESDGGIALSVGQFVCTVQWSYLDRVPNKELQKCVGGYLVQYEDGYQSWSPAEAFESGYRLRDA